jgi:ABC-type proline/glycine betaine transport system permease subunit
VLQLILLLVVAYAVYWFSHSWQMALAVIIGYYALSFAYGAWQANRAKHAAVQVISTPLSDTEKAHLGLIQERNQRLAERREKNKY